MKLTRAFACLGYALSMGFILALTVTAPAHAAVPGPVMVSAPNADAPPDHFMKLDYFAVASVHTSGMLDLLAGEVLASIRSRPEKSISRFRRAGFRHMFIPAQALSLRAIDHYYKKQQPGTKCRAFLSPFPS